MNTITVIGNVGQDPELRFAGGSGKAIARFSVADTRGKDDKKETTWHTVVCFEEQAENVCEQIKKGSRVLVTGRLSVGKWTDKEGLERTSHEIIADDVCLSLRWKSRNSDPVRNVTSAFNATEEDPF